MRLGAPTVRVDGDRAIVVAPVESELPGGVAAHLVLGAPRAFLPALDLTATPFAAAAAVLATTTGDALRIDAPVSPNLVDGLRRSMALLGGWIGRDPVPIEAPHRVPPAVLDHRRALLFTRGVDSSAALVDAEATGEPPDHLLTVAGLDLADAATGGAIAAETAGVATAVGYDHIALVAANRALLDAHADWRLAHSAVTSGAALLLGPLFSEVLVPAAPDGRDDEPDGAHAGLLAGYGTEHTSIRVVGDRTTRHDRIRVVAARKDLLAGLRVCGQPDTVGNCGRCATCLETMTVLEATGALADAPFPETLSVDAVLACDGDHGSDLSDTIAALPDDQGHLRRAWRAHLAAHEGRPYLQLGPVSPIVDLDLVLEVERAAAGRGQHVGPGAADGVPLGWGDGALVARAPRRLRHQLTAAPDGPPRRHLWCFVGDNGAVAARAVDRLTTEWGTGLTVARTHPGPPARRSDLPDDAAARIIRSSSLRAWSSEEPVFDGARALESCLLGAVPVQFGPADVAAVVRTHMPSGAEDLVVDVDAALPAPADLRAAGQVLRAELCRGSLERDVAEWFARLEQRVS